MLHLSRYRFCIIANVLEAGVVSYSTRKLPKGEKLAKDVYTVSIFAPVSACTVLNIPTNICKTFHSCLCTTHLTAIAVF